MIDIYFTRFNTPLPGNLFNQYLNCLPPYLQKKNSKYHRWEDRHSNLFGKLLLLRGLNEYGYSDKVLKEIKYNQYSRPYLEGDIDFSISHSGEYVLCSVCKGGRLGVDVEVIKEISFDVFKQVMTQDQWQDIYQSSDSLYSFYKYWTIKESVIKADSRGLSIPLLDIHVNNNSVCYDNKKWYLNEIPLDGQYSSFLASDKKNEEFRMKYIDYINGEQGY